MEPRLHNLGAPLTMSIDPATPKTRERILLLLKLRGPMAAADLASELGVTTMAVRQHLAGLDEEGLLDSREERRPVGRPARLWLLSDKAAEHFPMGYAELAVDMLDTIRETLGEDALHQVLDARIARQVTSYERRMAEAGEALQDRLAKLVELRREDGFLSEWHEAAPGEFHLIENHCPVRDAATCCQRLCEGEIDLFKAVLGEDVQITRAEHMLSEDRRCTYVVRHAPSHAV